MKKLILILLMLSFGCSNDLTYETFVTADAKANVERGKGKKQRSVYLKTQSKPSALRVGGRTLAEPTDYTGDLNLDETIDWDNDGVNDEVVIVQRCYFPKTFVEVTVNGTPVSYGVNWTSDLKILGFKDVDGDGFKDVIFEGGNPFAYNHGEAYNQYNVGFNVAGQTHNLKDAVQSLVIASADPNPEFIKWDLSAFGFNNYPFHVFLYHKDLNDDFGYEQTTTYGEFGFHTLNRLIVGETYVLRFTNLGDNCTDVEVEFTL